jgi:hypothetical protein
MVPILNLPTNRWSMSLARKCEHKYIYIATSLTPLLIIHCAKPGKWAVTHMCVRDIDFAYFYDFSSEFWNCSDDVLFVFQFI